ncbi:MarR family transcriptional regulator [Secundilactobacillus pentosiphilus]|uniref:MarR family transcriptional regulator n=1 Tax=Secundilactobacillus pentosiphilus TaxID=1714682 RepID=A0A1Z5IXY6_9LACO|nr:MarR family transcriptional regulator [Secundilactobacillus pentosiphilus]GAX06418.1 MarR family transcriptional regulator [Secundilactobacillus pentosiphilus]
MKSDDQNNIVSLEIMMTEFQRSYLFQRKFLRAYAEAPKKKFGITFDEYLIIHDIASSPVSLNSTNLATRHQVSKPAMTRLIKGLIQKRLIVAGSDEDKRNKIWQLTAKGTEIDKSFTEQELRNVKFWRDQVGSRKIQEFFSFLDEFQNAVKDTHGYFPVEGGKITNGKEE